MEYSNPQSLGRNIIHKFSKGEHIIGGKRWSKVDLSFSELSRRRCKDRSFILTIRYSNPYDREYQLNQFTMNEEEIKQFLEVINNTVNNEPQYKNYYHDPDLGWMPTEDYLNEILSQYINTIDCDVYNQLTKKYINKYMNSGYSINQATSKANEAIEFYKETYRLAKEHYLNPVELVDTMMAMKYGM